MLIDNVVFYFSEPLRTWLRLLVVLSEFMAPSIARTAFYRKMIARIHGKRADLEELWNSLVSAGVFNGHRSNTIQKVRHQHSRGKLSFAPQIANCRLVCRALLSNAPTVVCALMRVRPGESSSSTTKAV